MAKKQRSQKLLLSRDTLKVLNQKALEAAAGGIQLVGSGKACFTTCSVDTVIGC